MLEESLYPLRGSFNERHISRVIILPFWEIFWYEIIIYVMFNGNWINVDDGDWCKIANNTFRAYIRLGFT